MRVGVDRMGEVGRGDIWERRGVALLPPPLLPLLPGVKIGVNVGEDGVVEWLGVRLRGRGS